MGIKSERLKEGHMHTHSRYVHSRYVRTVALLVGIALLIGVLVTPIPTIAATPGEVLRDIAKPICWVVTIGVCIYFLDTGEPFGRYTSPEPIRCTPARFAGPPTFLTRPIMTVKYQFHGSCSRADMTNVPALNYRLEGSWTPGETNPNKPNASESLEITGYEPYLPDRAPGGRLFMYWTARCNREPWLAPEGGNCQHLRAYIPDDLRGRVTDLEPTTFPKTRIAIPANERQQLYARYLQLKLTSPATARANPRAKAPAPEADMMFTIVTPGINNQVYQGFLVVTAQPPKLGAPPFTDLELMWRDAPPGQPFSRHETVETSKLLQGLPISPKWTKGRYGRWEVRARIAPPTEGPWSVPVQFQMMPPTVGVEMRQPNAPITQPPPPMAQIPKPNAPITQTPVPNRAPLPSSSVTQPSPMPQPAPLPPPSVMQAPPPSSAPAQMNRSSSMFTTRGVEKKGGKKGSETVDQSAGTEKKP